MNISIIGTGYVGLVTGACFAEVGHSVVCVDNNVEKVKVLQSGGIPIYEPSLDELVGKNVKAGRLRFTASTKDGVENADVVFIAVPTPPQPDGSVDLSFIESVAREIALEMGDERYCAKRIDAYFYDPCPLWVSYFGSQPEKVATEFKTFTLP